MPFQQAGEREDVADVVVHDQHLFAGQGPVRDPQVLQQLLPHLRQLGHRTVQGQRGLVEQAFGRADLLEVDRMGQFLDAGFIAAVNPLGCVENHRHLGPWIVGQIIK